MAAEFPIALRILWHSADILRAGAHLSANKYGQPILGLIFLRYADILYKQHKNEIEKIYNEIKGGRIEKTIEEISKEVCGFYLPENAYFDYINDAPDNAEKATIVKEANATLKYARISARKVKIVADLIRGKDVDEALAIVKFTPKASSEIIEKLLKSAIANAENNHEMKAENLYVAEIYANQGPTLKRIRPAAKGSAVRIRKRTSHITIVLKERD